VYETKVVPLRTAAGRGGDELARLALRAASRPADRRELAARLVRAPALVVAASQLARGTRSFTADDLLRSTAERVERGIASLRADDDIVAWAGRILRNAAVELQREAVRDAAGTVPVTARQAAIDVEGSLVAPESDPERDRAIVLEAWERSSREPEVQLFWERLYLGLSLAQLARRSGRDPTDLLPMVARGGLTLLRATRERGGRAGRSRRGFRCIDPRLEGGAALRCAGLLDAGEVRGHGAHVAACHACEQAEREFARLSHALAGLGPEGDARASWRAQLDDRRHAGRRSLLPPPAVLIAAAGVVVALVVTVAWQRARDAAVVQELRALRAQVGQLREENRRLLEPGKGREDAGTE
jgi:DNA-directed RNA polymerase specialized sigma24 family protein